MDTVIKYNGIIEFELDNITKKNVMQSSWKKLAFVMIDGGDIMEYYKWFLNKRYNLKLNKLPREPHISFLNDSIDDIMLGLNCDEEIANQKFDEFKEKWNKKPIDIYLDSDLRTNGKFWWLTVPEIYRTELHDIRSEIGLSRPYWGLHMSIGVVKDVDLNYSNYILNNILNLGDCYK
jgi:hypothetical protein